MISQSNYDFRTKMVSKYGIAVHDCGRPWHYCASCGAWIDNSAIVTIPWAEYRSLDELIDHGLGVAQAHLSGSNQQDKQPRGTRCRCGREASLRMFDFHSYATQLSRDIVVRFESGPKPVSSLLLWEPISGVLCATDRSQISSKQVARDAIVRCLYAAREFGKIDNLAKIAKEAVGKIPGDPELLQFVSLLVATGHQGIAEAIINEHIQRFPLDPDGYCEMADFLMQMVANGLCPKKTLYQAADYVQRTLQLRPNCSRAKLIHCNLARIAGDKVAAKRLFGEFIKREPTNALAHYDFGLLLLDFEPVEALQHFSLGASIEPNDFDYRIGIARAAFKLRDLPTAKRALAEAKSLGAANDSRIHELEGQLKKCLY